MVSEIIQYAQKNGIAKHDIRASDFYDIMHTKAIVKGVTSRDELEQLETQHIEQEIEKGTLLFNMKKNQAYASRSRKTSSR